MDRLLYTPQANLSEKNYDKDQLILADDTVIDIVAAEYIGDYKLYLHFSDGWQTIVDFFPFLISSSNPMIREYLDLERFQHFTMAHGDLFWNDYELCFPIADLYEGRL